MFEPILSNSLKEHYQRGKTRPDRFSWERDLAYEKKYKEKREKSSSLLREEGFEVVGADQLVVGDLIVLIRKHEAITYSNRTGDRWDRYYIADGESMLNGNWLSLRRELHPNSPTRITNIVLDQWYTSLTDEKVKSGKSLRQSFHYLDASGCAEMACWELRKNDSSSDGISFLHYGETLQRWVKLPMPQLNKDGLLRQWVVRMAH